MTGERASLAALRARLGALASADDARFAQRYFKTGPGQYAEGDRFVGVRVPVLRKLARSYLSLPIEQAFELLVSNIHEERFVALLLLRHHFERGDPSTQRAVYEGYLAHARYVNNWDLVDTSAPHIVGAYLLTRSRRPLYLLARSSLLWERRIAILATHHFIRHADIDDALALSGSLLGDPHDLMHKAVGWTLREAWKVDSARVESLLAANYARLPRTALRYAIERLAPAERRRWLAGPVVRETSVPK